VRRAEGYEAQLGVQSERKCEHVETGRVVGIDMGWKFFDTDSAGETVENLPSSSPRRGSPRARSLDETQTSPSPRLPKTQVGPEPPTRQTTSGQSVSESAKAG
jgi:hypothetical protein